MAIPRTKPGNYPAVLSYGFRPFFLAGALYAGIAILFWLPLLYGRIDTQSVFAPVDWHIHEMLFGYVAAVVTGFLLTAIPNWTGRLPLGHTGRDLRAGADGCIVFGAILLAAVLRICAAFHPEQALLLHGSAAAWTAAFLGYAALFGPMLVRPRLRSGEPDGRILGRFRPFRKA